MTAEKKKGRYVYYRCTGYHGACGNSYIREEQLATLLSTVLTPIQVTPAIADDIAGALRVSHDDSEQREVERVHQLELHERLITERLDRGYEDL